MKQGLRYVKVHTDLPDDVWLDSLPDNTYRYAWLLMFVTPQIVKPGIYELNINRLASRLHIRKSRVETILNRFESDGRIIRENEYLFICNFTKSQLFSGDAQLSVMKEVDSLVSVCPNLVTAWRERYRGYTDGGASIRKSIRKRNSNTREESESDDSPPPVWADKIPLVETCRDIIAKASETYDLGKPPTNDLDKSAKVIEQCIRLDGIDDIETLCSWIMADDFWRGNMRSIPQWRKRGNNGEPKIKNALMAMRGAITPPGESAVDRNMREERERKEHEDRMRRDQEYREDNPTVSGKPFLDAMSAKLHIEPTPGGMEMDADETEIERQRQVDEIKRRGEQ